MPLVGFVMRWLKYKLNYLRKATISKLCEEKHGLSSSKWKSEQKKTCLKITLSPLTDELDQAQTV